MKHNNERQWDIFLVGQYGDIDNAYMTTQNVATVFFLLQIIIWSLYIRWIIYGYLYVD